MKLLDKRWDISRSEWSAKSLLVKELSISPITAQVLINRGLTSTAEAQMFLRGSVEDLHSPWELSGMKKSVKRILDALKNREKILIFGDYDVDGMTATAILVSFLQKEGVQIGYYIPQRSEGYGLNIAALEKIREQGYDLIITVDCGISNGPEIAYGKELGLDFVITDHHEPGPNLPALETIINPKLEPNKNGLTELAGVGVAFKLIQALGEELELENDQKMSYLDLVALGTVADMVPLVGENRLLVKAGLPLLTKTSRLGLKALLEVAGVDDKEINATHVGFMLAPRLNAAGRMGSPLLALELLLTTSAQKARELALQLQELNKTRQLIEQQTTKEAMAMIQAQGEAVGEQVLVLASPLWHTGVLGIVASRLVDIFYRPVILLAMEGDQATGSGRSIPGFDLYQGLRHCDDLLAKAGGHSQAVGMTVEAAKLEDFRQQINSYAEPVLDEKLLKPFLKLEMEVFLEQLDFQLIDELAQLEPFGYGNPEPVFALRHVHLRNYRGVGKDGRHLKLNVIGDEGDIDGIGFNMGSYLETEMKLEEAVDLAFRLERNHWNDQTRLQLVIEDLKKYEPMDTEKNITLGREKMQEISRMVNGDEISSCTHGGEQFQIALELAIKATLAGKAAFILFPSQRLLAIFERLLEDSLLRQGIQCRRWNSLEFPIPKNTVFLAVEGQLSPTFQGEGHKTIRLLYPSLKEQLVGFFLETVDFQLGFKQILPDEYDFIREPISVNNKLPYLAELTTGLAKPLFLYTNRKKQALELFNGLRQLLPELKNKIWYYHQGLCLEQKETVYQAAYYGLTDVIIASEFMELSFSAGGDSWERVIIDAPYSLEELFLKSRPHGKGMRVRGIWHQEELQLNDRTLKSIFPDGPPLEALLHKLIELGTTQEMGSKQFLGELRKRFPSIQIPTVRYGLDIIKELQVRKNSTSELDYKATAIYRAAELEKGSFAKLTALDQQEAKWPMDFLLAGTTELK